MSVCALRQSAWRGHERVGQIMDYRTSINDALNVRFDLDGRPPLALETGTQAWRISMRNTTIEAVPPRTRETTHWSHARIVGRIRRQEGILLVPVAVETRTDVCCGSCQPPCLRTCNSGSPAHRATQAHARGEPSNGQTDMTWEEFLAGWTLKTSKWRRRARSLLKMPARSSSRATRRCHSALAGIRPGWGRLWILEQEPKQPGRKACTWALALDGERQPPLHVAADGRIGPGHGCPRGRRNLGACAFTVPGSVTRDAAVSAPDAGLATV